MKKRDDIYLLEIEARIEKIKSHLKKLSKSKFLKSDLHRSAVIRELEVIGEAASKVSEQTKDKFKQIPWGQMIGMRNRLIHGYFAVDDSIVWEVASGELPKLMPPIREAILDTAPPLHKWRLCPVGYYSVRRYKRSVGTSAAHPSGKTDVRRHCRRNPSGRDKFSKDVRVGKRNFARGPFQITDETRKALGNEKGELKDHYLTLTDKDVKNPTIATAAAIRWLFQKRKLASIYLKREATWEEAVAEYKSYLRRKKSYREQKGMLNYLNFYNKLENLQ
jgi:uncharacterized protein with HEPN domain